MIGHYHVHPVTDEEMAGIDSVALEVINFFQEYCRINGYTITDYTDYLGVEDARGDNVKFELAVRVNYGMSGIIAS
jgi:hypothetical protein